MTVRGVEGTCILSRLLFFFFLFSSNFDPWAKQP